MWGRHLAPPCVTCMGMTRENRAVILRQARSAESWDIIGKIITAPKEERGMDGVHLYTLLNLERSVTRILITMNANEHLCSHVPTTNQSSASTGLRNGGNVHNHADQEQLSLPHHEQSTLSLRRHFPWQPNGEVREGRCLTYLLGK